MRLQSHRRHLLYTQYLHSLDHVFREKIHDSAIGHQVPLVSDKATHDQVTSPDQTISILRQMDKDICQDIGHDDICLTSTPFSKSPELWMFSNSRLSLIFSGATRTATSSVIAKISLAPRRELAMERTPDLVLTSSTVSPRSDLLQGKEAHLGCCGFLFQRPYSQDPA